MAINTIPKLKTKTPTPAPATKEAKGGAAITPATSADRFPLLALRRGVAVMAKQYARAIKIGGIDLGLRTTDEKKTLLLHLTRLHDLLPGHYQYYYRAQREPLTDITDQYRALRETERNPEIKRLNFGDSAYMKELGKTNPPVRRDCYLVCTLLKGAKKQVRGSINLSAVTSGKFIGMVTDEFREMFYFLTGRKTPEQAAELVREQNYRDDVPAETTALFDQHLRHAVRSYRQAGTAAVAVEQDEYIQLLAAQLGGNPQLGQPALDQIYGDIAESYDHLKITRHLPQGGEQVRYVSVYAAVEWPTRLRPGWLDTLIRLNGVAELEISTHYTIIPDKKALRKIKDAEHEINYDKDGHLAEHAQYLLDSLRMMKSYILEREGHIHVGTIYVAVSAPSEEELRASRELVEAEMAALGLEPALQTLDIARAYAAVLPLGTNEMLRGKLLTGSFQRNLVSVNTAFTMLNTVAEVNHAGGIVYGVAQGSNALVRINNRSFANSAHAIVLGKTGSGKTFAQVVKCARKLMTNPKLEIIVVDPQGGFEPFCREVGGALVDCSPTSGVIINPMDRWAGGRELDIVTKRDYLVGLFGLMQGGIPLDPYEKLAHGQAIKELYRHFEGGESASSVIANALYIEGGQAKKLGIPHYTQRMDIASVIARAEELDREIRVAARLDEWVRHCTSQTIPQPLPPEITRYASEVISEDPTMQHLLSLLTTSERQRLLRILTLEYRLGTPTLFDHLIYLYAGGGFGAGLAYKLGNFVDPDTDGQSYDGLTNIDVEDNRFICFSIRDASPERWPIVIYTILGFVWNRLVDEIKERELILDEFGVLMEQGIDEVAAFAAMMAMRGRALGLALTVMAQDGGAFITTKQGREILANASIREVGYQDDPTAIDTIQALLGFTDGEASVLPHLLPGEFVMRAGRVGFQLRYSASDEEFKRWDTKVESRAAKRARKVN